MGVRIGAGASGSVFAAEDEQKHTQVVIKLFDGVMDGFSAWNDEMRLILRMSHPNIVPCLDVGFDQQLGMWTLVLERQEGGSLRRWMSDPAQRQRLPVYSILHDIASALAFVHQKGVIHRDVKPDNVLAQSRALPTRWMLCDFGAGRFLSNGQSAVSLAGSLMYMAPEVLSGAASALSDQYSLGVMGIELLTGQTPTAEAIESFRKAHVGHPTLRGLVARLVEKEPENRYPVLDEFLARVDELETPMTERNSEERILAEYLTTRKSLSSDQLASLLREWQKRSQTEKERSLSFADFLVEQKLLDRILAKTLRAMRMGYVRASDGEMRRTLGLAGVEQPQTESIAPVAEATESAPQKAESAPQKTASAPQQTESAPQKTASAPQQTESAPQKTASAPQPTLQKAEAAPQRVESIPKQAETPAIEILAMTSSDQQPVIRPQLIEAAAPPTLVPPHDVLQTGQYLGKYPLEEVLGEGSTATIYRSYHKLLGVPIAIKRFKPELFQRRGEKLERILREGQLMVNLEHPNIVRVLDIAEHEGVPFIVFEYVSELSLLSIIENIGRLPSERVAQIGAQVTAALSVASAQGLLHRDVKPDNILVRKDGQVKLADFGIATRLMSDGRTGDELARAGLISGTPQYIAPEQIKTPAEIDSRADIYSLGATLYHAATGHPPFDFETLDEVLNAHLAAIPPPLQTLVPSMDTELAQLIERMLNKRPQDRPQSLQQLSADFSRIAERIIETQSAHRQTVLASHSSSMPAIAPGSQPPESSVAAQAIIPSASRPDSSAKTALLLPSPSLSQRQPPTSQPEPAGRLQSLRLRTYGLPILVAAVVALLLLWRLFAR